MSLAWKILLALTFSRLCIGLQFQSIPALAADLSTEAGLSFAAIGALTGAYLLPGVVAALATGWLGQRLGDIRTVNLGLILMTAGSLGMLATDSFAGLMVLRVMAGIGGVGLNVMLSKMAADWFQDRSDLPSAMGLLVSSWPAGLALAMLVMPLVSNTYGLSAALGAPGVLSLIALLVLLRVWQSPPVSNQQATRSSADKMRPQEWFLVSLAGSIWGLYNVALIATIAWVPGILQMAGLNEIAASAAVSMVGWAAIVSVAAGGWLAGQLPWRDLPTLVCFVLTAACILMLPVLGVGGASPLVMGGLGLIFGIAAAMIMTLPVEAACPQFRSIAMGTYFAIYYAFMGLAPAAFGALRDSTGNPAAPLQAAAALLIVCLTLWLGFRAIQKKTG